MPSERHQAVIDSIHEDPTHGYHARFKGLALTSHFQPIYSLSHSRVVGHEGLLRARDANGAPISPLDVFANCANEDEASWCDSASRAVHLRNFVRQGHVDQWLFLNVRPEALLTPDDEWQAYLAEISDRLRLPANHIVVELLERHSLRTAVPRSDGSGAANGFPDRAR